MIPKKWSEDELLLLKESYENLSKESVLSKFPNYKWRYLQNIAISMGVKRKFNSKRKGNIQNLFNGTIESFYWIGLIISDGYISSDGELKISLSIKDSEYLNNLAIFLDAELNTFKPYKGDKHSSGTCRVKIKDVNYGVKLRNLLKIKGQKTYNPVSINFVKTKSQMLGILGGHIDGDGSIDKRGNIRIHAHINYYDYMIRFGEKLKGFGIITKFTVNKYEDMCRFDISRYDSLSIKNELNKLKLPIMKRKWDRISNEKKVRNYLMEHKETIIKMRKLNKTYKEICDKINYKSVGSLCTFIKKNNLC